MRGYGLTPPGSARVLIPVAALSTSKGAICPFCGGTDTVLESGFGVTLCRSTHFCRACRNPFEGFKPKETASLEAWDRPAAGEEEAEGPAEAGP